MQPNPNLVQWLETHSIQEQGKRALKVGCGLGDDVEELCQHGFQAVGFDISVSAIAWCHRQFPESRAEYFENYLDQESPPVRRFRAPFRL